MQNIHFRLTLVAQKRPCLNYSECILQLIDICVQLQLIAQSV